MARGLILTVGGSVESEAFCIMQTDPEWVAFLCTPGSREHVDEIIEETRLSLSHHQIWEFPDSAESVGTLVHQAHAALRWLEDKCGADAEITINPTAGRKWMSMGLGLFASRTSARQVYVDVDYDGRTPVPSTMRLVDLGNAQDHTGLLDADVGVELFNRGDFEGAARVFERIAPKLAAARDLYRGLCGLCEALHRWDRFEHYGGAQVAMQVAQSLDAVTQAGSELAMAPLERFAEAMRPVCQHIRDVEQGDKPSLLAVVDLLHNAKRRIAAGRLDDAVARLYRALEATGQWMLAAQGVAASNVDWTKLSVPQCEEYDKRDRPPQGARPTKISLKQSFTLAHVLAAEGSAGFFDQQGRFTYEKHLRPRNDSILAHGWSPAAAREAENFANQLTSDIQALNADLSGWEIPQMPRLWA